MAAAAKTRSASLSPDHWEWIIDRTGQPGGYRWFIRNILRTVLYPKTSEICDAIQAHPRVAVRSCHGSGKSFVVGRITVAYLVENAGDCIVITTAPTERQVRDVTWKEVGGAYASSILPLGGTLNQTELKFSRRWFAKGFTARTNDLIAFQGYHAPKMLILLDEASGVDPAIWGAIETLRSGGDVKILAIGNPNAPEGPFFDCFTRRSAYWYPIHISAFDTPNVRARRTLIPGMVEYEWVKEHLETYGEDSPVTQVRVFGDFPSQTDSTLIPLLWVVRARENPPLHPAGEHNTHADPIDAGLDVAWTGLDESALGIKCGNRLIEPIIAWSGMDTVETTRIVKERLGPYRDRLRRLNIDVIGIGAGVYDNLKHDDWPVVPVNGSNSPRANPQAYNLRAEMAWELREQFRQQQIGGEIDPLTEHQLTSIRYRYTPGGKIQIERKDEYKQRLKGMSPDRAEALLYTFVEVPGPELRSWDERTFGEGTFDDPTTRPWDDDDPELSVPGFAYPREERRYPAPVILSGRGNY